MHAESLDGYSASGSSSRQVVLPHHSLSSTVALWPPLLTNRISYWDCTDEVQGERDCCESAIFVISWVVSAWAVLGGQKAEGMKQKSGGSHSGVQSRMGSWDKVPERRTSLIEAA